jgi:predicted nucleotidyltransferase
MDLRRLLQEKRDEILRITAAHKASNVRVFGSVVRGEAAETSDIDFLVEFGSASGLLDYAALVRELEALLGCKVDVVSEQALKERFRDRVLREARAL